MVSIHYSIILVAIVSLIGISPCFPSSHEASNGPAGFLTSLISPFSVESPFYNPNLTSVQRVDTAVKRSFNRYHYFQSRISKPTFKTWISPEPPEGYVMSYYVGSPPVRTYALVDTGSHLMWLQCSPCDSCFEQPIPIFKPLESQSYKELDCHDYRCGKARGRCGRRLHICTNYRCTWGFSPCKYVIKYEDGSSSAGEIALETLTFTGVNATNGRQQNITMSEMIIGCGRKNKNTMSHYSVPGVIGLDRSGASFIYQQGFSYFGYCFVPWYSKSKGYIHFETTSEIRENSTPMLSNPSAVGRYYLYLEGMSVDDVCLPIPAGTFNITDNGHGGFMIDSGTAFTFLDQTALLILIKELRPRFSQVVEDPYDLFYFCYKQRFGRIVPPAITFHFKGVDLKLDKMSSWVHRGWGVYCLAMVPTTDASVFGHYQQQNLYVGYDYVRKTVSFEKRDCTKQY